MSDALAAANKAAAVRRLAGALAFVLAELRRADPDAAEAERFAAARPGAPKAHCNAQMSSPMVRRHCRLDAAGQALMKQALTRLGLSARAYDRILKVARTTADLAGAEAVEPQHLAEAVQYRSLDRAGWAG